MLRHNVTYLRLSLVPALWVIVPLVLVISQLEFHFGYTAWRRSVRARHGDGAGESADRDAPALYWSRHRPCGLHTPAVWLPAARGSRVAESRRRRRAKYLLEVHLDEQVFSKTLRVSTGVGRRSPVRLAGRDPG